MLIDKANNKTVNIPSFLFSNPSPAVIAAISIAISVLVTPDRAINRPDDKPMGLYMQVWLTPIKLYY